MELIHANLLVVEKSTPNGEAKICRVHDAIRQFCRKEAKSVNLNLFQEISRTDRGDFEPSLDNIRAHHRLCIYSFLREFLLTNPKVPYARTFMCSPLSAIDLDGKEMSPVTQTFQLLRILDAENINFPRFPKDLTTLIHLRYLPLTFTKDQNRYLPEAMSNLWNLQTLIVDTEGILEIKANIWIMKELRHLKTKASILLKKEGKGKGGDKLQTLDRLSPHSCTDTVFDKAKKLRKLGIQGDLSSLNSRSLDKLEILNKLKLVHEAGTEQASLSCQLPDAKKLPPNIKILVLISTHLKWEQMSVLESLVHLEVLKLKKNAFTGDSWVASTGGFEKLELLLIETTDVVSWTATNTSFPELRFLLLKDCKKLEKVPLVLSKKLEMLSLENVKQSAFSSAKEIQKTRGAKLVLHELKMVES